MAIERDYARATLKDALQVFINLRRMHLIELAALAPTDWERTGQHAEQGQITILAHTQHMISHDLVPAAQIARQLDQISKP